MKRIVELFRKYLPPLLAFARASSRWLLRRASDLQGWLWTRAARYWPRLSAWWKGGGPRALLARVLRMPLVRVPLSGLALGALCLALVLSAAVRVSPGRIGVRQIDWGPGSGIESRDYTSGLHWGWRPRASWHWIDGTTKFLRFAWKAEGGDHAPLEMRTIEGNTAQIALSVPYRVKRGEAHAIVQAGAKATYVSQTKSIVERALLQELAGSRSEDLYSTDRREAIATQALARMNEDLAPLHVEALGVYISGVTFPATYEKKLQEMQLDGQSRLTDQAQAAIVDASFEMKLLEDEIAREEARTERGIAEELATGRMDLDAELARIAREAEAYSLARRAEGDEVHALAQAEGQLELARARAEAEKLSNQALDSTGGRLMLAREAASKLRFTSVTLDASDPRVPSPLNLDEMVSVLVGHR